MDGLCHFTSWHKHCVGTVDNMKPRSAWLVKASNDKIFIINAMQI